MPRGWSLLGLVCVLTVVGSARQHPSDQHPSDQHPFSRQTQKLKNSFNLLLLPPVKGMLGQEHRAKAVFTLVVV